MHTLAGAPAATIRSARMSDPIFASPVRRRTRVIRSILSCHRHSRWSNSAAACGSEVEWFVNGARVAPERDGRFFWQLAAGEWNVRAVSREKFAEQKIIVEGMSN